MASERKTPKKRTATPSKRRVAASQRGKTQAKKRKAPQYTRNTGSRIITRVTGGFKMDGVMVRGVVPTAQRLFYPEYTGYVTAVHGPLRATPEEKKMVRADCRDKVGMERGRLVDDQISKLVTLMARYDISPEMLLLDKGHRSMLAETIEYHCDKDRTALQYLLPSMHAFTIEFLKLMKKKKWVAVASQVMCASSMARLGTAVDVVVRQRNSPTHILLEIKCGYFKYLKRYSAKMHEPYQRLDNCPLNQFMLQLYFSRVLYRRTYEAQKNCEAYVVVLHEYGHDLHKLSAAVVNGGKAAWNKMIKSSTETSDQRKKAKDKAAAAFQARKKPIASKPKPRAKPKVPKSFKPPPKVTPRRPPTPPPKSRKKRTFTEFNG